MKRYIYIIFLYAAVSVSAQNAGIIDPSYSAMNSFSSGFNSYANGVYSLGGNPALLALPGKHNFEISTVLPVPNLNVTLGNDILSLDDYNYFFTGKTDANGNTTGLYLSNEEKQKFRDLFSEGTEVRSNVSLTLFAFSFYKKEWGGFGFSIKDKGAVSASLPRDLVDLFLDGNEKERVYNFDETSLRSWYVREYSLSYGYRIPLFEEAVKNFSVGISAKMLHGFTYNGLSKFSTSLKTLDDNTINVKSNIELYSAFSNDFGVEYDFDEDSSRTSSFSPFPSPAGKGYAFDIGFALELNDVWSFGLTLSDIGTLSWNKTAAMYSNNSEFILDDVTDDELLDSLFSTLEPEGEYINEFSTPLTTSLGLGSTFRLDRLLEGNFPGTMLIMVDFNIGLNNTSYRSAEPVLFSGFEWKPWKWLPLRSGLAIGGYDNFGWQLGFGFDLNLFEINFSTSNLQTFYATESAKRISLGLNTRWKF